MESPHPEERPLKKRRFFTENSSPARPASPSLVSAAVVRANSPLGISDGNVEVLSGETLDGFDVETLQAIVGELPHTVLQQLKRVSGGDVQRGLSVHLRRTTKTDSR